MYFPLANVSANVTDVAISLVARFWGDALNVIIGLATLGTSVPTFIPPKDKKGTAVVVGLGLGPEPETLGGHRPGIAVWDVYGKKLGHIAGSRHKITNGSPWEILVPHYPGIGGPQAQYIAISNGGDDAICIAYVRVIWTKEEKFGWTGDVGEVCHSDWYHSETIIRDGGEGGRQHKPKCVWLDRDRSFNHRHQGLSIHIIDFDIVTGQGRKYQYAEYPETMCSRPRYHTFDNMKVEDGIYIFDPVLEYTEDGTDKDIRKVLVGGKPTDPDRKPLGYRENNYYAVNRTVSLSPRQLKRRAEFLRDVLVMSGWPGHGAKELCRSQTSLGPDFVSLNEGLFCDMESKELWPLCKNGTVSHACFDVATRTMKGGKIGTRDMISGRAIPSKAYRDVRDWGR